MKELYIKAHKILHGQGVTSPTDEQLADKVQDLQDNQADAAELRLGEDR